MLFKSPDYTTPFLTRTKVYNQNAERYSVWNQFKGIFSDENPLIIIFVLNHCIDHYTTPFLTRTIVYNKNAERCSVWDQFKAIISD